MVDTVHPFDTKMLHKLASKGVTPPSPRLSMDETEPDTGLQKVPQVPSRPTPAQASPVSIEPTTPYDRSSSDIDFEKDPTGFLRAKGESLIYWENPSQSGAVSVGLFSVLIMTHHYSLLYLASAAFTLVAGINWLYVILHQQGQRVLSGTPANQVINPHSERLENGALLISRGSIERTSQLAVNLAEALIHQVTRLILVEDHYRTGCAIGVSYFVWTLAKYISVKYLLAIAILSAFSLPQLYHQHRNTIDQYIAQVLEQFNANIQQHTDKVGDLAYQFYDNIITVARQQLKRKAVSE